MTTEKKEKKFKFKIGNIVFAYIDSSAITCENQNILIMGEITERFFSLELMEFQYSIRNVGYINKKSLSDVFVTSYKGIPEKYISLNLKEIKEEVLNQLFENYQDFLEELSAENKNNKFVPSNISDFYLNTKQKKEERILESYNSIVSFFDSILTLYRFNGSEVFQKIYYIAGREKNNNSQGWVEQEPSVQNNNV